METVTKVKSQVSTKQKVMVAVGIVSILAAAFGLMNSIGKARGFGFGYPFVKNLSQERIAQLEAVRENTSLFGNQGLRVRNLKSTSGISVERKSPVLNVEVCTNGVDDDGNGKVDCNDLYCYTRDLAPVNVCAGENGTGKVLLIGAGYGFIEPSQIKSDFTTSQKYLTGAVACQQAFGKNCAFIEVFGNSVWLKASTLDCSTQIDSNNYNLNKQYRAVCTGVQADSPQPPNSGSSGVINF